MLPVLLPVFQTRDAQQRAECWCHRTLKAATEERWKIATRQAVCVSSDRQHRHHTKVDPTDFRNKVPRFAPEARAANLALVDLLKRVAERKRGIPEQIALAWPLARKPWIGPIPGTTKLHRLTENVGAASIQLTNEDLREIEDTASQITVQGARLPEEILKLSNR
jgi:aryl-alcohol dehydrogenase-like predicted oxidoreductase